MFSPSVLTYKTTSSALVSPPITCVFAKHDLEVYTAMHSKPKNEMQTRLSLKTKTDDVVSFLC